MNFGIKRRKGKQDRGGLGLCLLAWIWGPHTDRLRNIWLSYSSKVDSLPSLYLAAMFFCVTMDKYIEKKENVLVN